MRGISMLSRVNKEALDALLKEINDRGGGRFASYMIGRLKNEDPYYSIFIELLVHDAKASGNDPKDILEVAAACYRILEITERIDTSKRYAARLMSDADTRSGHEKTVGDEEYRLFIKRMGAGSKKPGAKDSQ